jgi:hypothetical protein
MTESTTSVPRCFKCGVPWHEATCHVFRSDVLYCGQCAHEFFFGFYRPRMIQMNGKRERSKYKIPWWYWVIKFDFVAHCLSLGRLPKMLDGDFNLAASTSIGANHGRKGYDSR